MQNPHNDTSSLPIEQEVDKFHDCASTPDTQSDINDNPKSMEEKRPVTEAKGSVGFLEHVENIQPKPARLSRTQKIKKHFRRFWCCYLVGLVIFLAVALPVLFLVILPAIIQLLVGKADLPINGGAFLANTPTTAIVSIDTVLSIPSGIKATLDPLTLYLYNKNTTVFSPFLGVDLDKTYLDGNTAVNVTNKLVNIINQTEMESWFEGVIQNVKTPISVKGDTTVHFGALKAHVNIDKTEEVPTLNGLTGFDFSGLQLVLPADANGTNFSGNITIPNYSPLAIGLGNLTLNILSGSILIGNVYLQDVVAPPGNTTMMFTGEIFFSDIISNIGPIISSQATAIRDGNLNISASGNSSIINGQHIGYVENVLNKQHLSAEIPIIQLIAQVAGSLLSGNDSLGELGSLLGGLLGNLTEPSSGSSSSSSSTGGSLGSLFNLTELIHVASRVYSQM